MLDKNYNNIVILTGAGISAESGIKTFRDHDGLWENNSIEEVASPEGFESNPKLVYEFYNQRRTQLLSAEVTPNKAHEALADLEQSFTGKVLIVTQNVDDLHERAGNRNIKHMHGELLKMRCSESMKVYEAPPTFDENDLCPCCQKAGNLRPHIVWFGEMPFDMDIIMTRLKECDLFISIGTSSLVYPAAMFIEWVKQHNQAETLEINFETTPNTTHFDYSIQGRAGNEVPKVVEKLLRKES
jgi:NAD-dependent deacetylase